MSLPKSHITADFLKHQDRKLFYVLLEPSERKAKASILFLHPFAEEMHKSRHLVATQARALVDAGYNVMLLDLSGCGDSGGEFSDANWKTWLQDAAYAAETLVNLAAVPVMLWGLRLGALLACELSQSRSDVAKLILWQPVLNGEQHIDQFLRLQSVGLATDKQLTTDRKTLWSELRSGRSLEIAGYELPSVMALEIAKVRLNDLKPGCPVIWLEIGNPLNDKLTIASQNVIAHWQEQGEQVDWRSIPGEPFWRTVDAADNLDLQRATLEML